MAFVLYKWGPEWGLPSSSAASLQVEAYLRLQGVEFAAEDRTSASTSPSGQLPALEVENLVVEGRSSDEYDVARSLIAFLKENGQDLDASLTPEQKSQLLAYTALIQAKLEPASLYTTWCEWESYSLHTRVRFVVGQSKAVVGASLPTPLNYIIPWTQRRAALKRFATITAEEVYREAAACYGALAAHLSAFKGTFFLGSQPSSLDALLYGHLALHLSAPTTAPELQQAVASHPILRDYANRVADIFSTPVPPAPPASSTQEWSERADASASGSRSNSRSRKQMSAKEREQRRWNYYWLAMAAGVIATYVVFSGQYIDFSMDFEEDDEPEE